MAREALLDNVDLPKQNIHPVPYVPSDAPAAAAQYAEVLEQMLPKRHGAAPEFDLMYLGVGDDGHTASLFPDTAILEEQQLNVAAVYVKKFDAWRVSVTYPVINSAKHIVVLAAGEGKADVVNDIFSPQAHAMPYPVQRIHPNGVLTWYLDQAAAKRLPAHLYNDAE
jgi:6-phosphogluconolactonase